MLKSMRDMALGNLLIKLFSVVFAVILWLHVVARGTSEVSFMVPLELRDVPRGMMVVGGAPAYVDVRVQGQEGTVRHMAVRDLTAYVSLSGAKPGESDYSLTPSSVSAPGNVKVAAVTPREVRLRLERVVQRQVPVVPAVSGRPATGYRLKAVEVSPKAVTASGPEGSMEKVRGVSTERVDIQGLKGGFDRLVRLAPPPEYGVKLDEDSVRVTVTFARTRAMREE